MTSACFIWHMLWCGMPGRDTKPTWCCSLVNPANSLLKTAFCVSTTLAWVWEHQHCIWGCDLAQRSAADAAGYCLCLLQGVAAAANFERRVGNAAAAAAVFDTALQQQQQQQQEQKEREQPQEEDGKEEASGKGSPSSDVQGYLYLMYASFLRQVSYKPVHSVMGMRT